ncbi:MAG: single-stranded DNA-binding protein [Candidatus Taylorbacteria bacterium]|nr:single-stranded DNA-binding protein [Candidatus Taylorbacteria bacterium]
MNLNKVFIVGRLTQDPEMRSTSTGQNVTTLNIATNRVWTDKSGQKQEAVEYHRVIAWARLGEIAGQYLKKGGLVLIEGRIQTRSWTDQTNNKRYTTEIIVENLQLGPRTAGSASAGGGSYEPRSASAGGPAVSDVRKPASVPDSDIPIIGENEPISSGMEEEERKINEKDLPF